MVALLQTSQTQSQNTLHARGQVPTCNEIGSIRSKPKQLNGLCKSIDARDAQLGSCSRDPIGFHDGTSLYKNYFGLAGVDPEGLCATGCSCVVEEVDIFPTDKFPKLMDGMMPNGANFYGNVFIVTIKLRYEVNNTGKMEPCTLCWGENTDFITDPNPWKLEKDKWKNLYSSYEGKGEDEHLGQFKKQNDKFMSGEQECPGAAEITITDTPALAKTGKNGFGFVRNVTAKRRLSWFIRVTSGKQGAGSKSATAQQQLNINNGKLENDSYFKSPGEGLNGWPKDSFDGCKETASGKPPVKPEGSKL